MYKRKIQLSLILSLFLVLLLIFDASFFYGMKITIHQLDVDYQNLKSTLIPENMNDKTIVYFTDLQYGKFENKERSKKVFHEIKALNPDILIFGGDLFDTETQLNDQNIEFIKKSFASIEAPLGKYAVWGEKDTQDASRQEQIEQLYKDAQVEVLDNKQVSVSNQSKNSIHVIGLTSSQGIKDACSHCSSKTYNLLITHKPDTLSNEKLASISISYALAGHAHATQINYPILGAYRNEKGSRKLNLSSKKRLSFPYLLSTGVGTTHVDVRYRSKPEIHYITLKSKS